MRKNDKCLHALAIHKSHLFRRITRIVFDYFLYEVQFEFKPINALKAGH